MYGIIYATATVTFLVNKYGITVNYCNDSKVPDSLGRLICGHIIEDRECIIIVEEFIISVKTVADRIKKL